jgi:uncharacterized protein YjiS (DUF1127 family)
MLRSLDASPHHFLPNRAHLFVRLANDAVWSVGRCLERQRQLRELAELDDHLLRDIGLSGADVKRACSQSFWMR